MMTANELVDLLEKKILKETSLKDKLSIIASYAKKLTKAERCSIFIFDKEKDQLQSLYSDGIKGTLKLKSNVGIVGYTFHKKIAVLENNISKSPIFCKAVDQKSGYTTKHVLSIPILKDNKRLGVIQLLNKENGFTSRDQQYINILVSLLSSLLIPQATNVHKSLQDDVDIYLEDKKLYLMEDGNAYYKILNMQREYYIGADKCYRLDLEIKEIALYYYAMGDEFLSKKVYVKIDDQIESILISEQNGNENFEKYSLEKD